VAVTRVCGVCVATVFLETILVGVIGKTTVRKASLL